MTTLYALARNGTLVVPNTPFPNGGAITTEFPDVDVPGCEWLPVVDEGGRGRPSYRVHDGSVVRSCREDA